MAKVYSTVFGQRIRPP
jgi:hypothetical protein